MHDDAKEKRNADILDVLGFGWARQFSGEVDPDRSHWERTTRNMDRAARVSRVRRRVPSLRGAVGARRLRALALSPVRRVRGLRAPVLGAGAGGGIVPALSVLRDECTAEVGEAIHEGNEHRKYGYQNAEQEASRQAALFARLAGVLGRVISQLAAPRVMLVLYFLGFGLLVGLGVLAVDTRHAARGVAAVVVGVGEPVEACHVWTCRRF